MKSKKVVTKASERKSKRKEKRQSKKKRSSTALRNDYYDQEEQERQEKKKKLKLDEQEDQLKKSNKKKQKKKEKKKYIDKNDPYANLDEATANLLRAEDDEIADLERKLGISSSSSGIQYQSDNGKKDGKSKIKKEYAKLEAFGDDFGDFLFDDLDGIVDNILGPSSSSSEAQNYEEDEEMSEEFGEDGLDLQEESDEEIDNEHDDIDELEEEDYSEQSEDEEIIPMKEGSPLRDESDEEINDLAKITSDENSDSDDEDSNSNTDSSNSDSDNESEKAPDHNISDTYRPATGEDIYGNRFSFSQNANSKPSKYIPPHLRNKTNTNNNSDTSTLDSSETPTDQEELKAITRSMRGMLNRLSENTLESILLKNLIPLLYKNSTKSYSTNLLNDALSSLLIKELSLHDYLIKEKFIPMYSALIAGLHYMVGKHVSSYMIEYIVMLFDEVKYNQVPLFLDEDEDAENGDIRPDDNKTTFSKKGCNLILLLCYLYNFHIVHCTFMYDIIRSLIEKFQEVDVEILLLIINHCGKSLRKDDPASLKNIILSVQERALQAFKENDNDEESGEDDDNSEDDDNNDLTSSSMLKKSRVQFMLDAMTDLKNNNPKQYKKSKKASAQFRDVEERTSTYQKVLGRIKQSSATSKSNNAAGSTTCLRMSLQDIYDIPTKGRWWITGASWIGHQNNGDSQENGKDSNKSKTGSNTTVKQSNEERKLMKLAQAARMNTDSKKQIFCVIMGSSDCEDAFTKLVSSEILTSSFNMKDVSQVLIECCLQEKSYNPFYALLGSRICDFNKKFKRTLHNTCSNVFQRLIEDSNVVDETSNKKKTRQAANVAKLVSQLIQNGILKIKVFEHVFLEGQEEIFSADQGQEPSPIVICLVVLFTNILSNNNIENRENVRKMFSPRKVAQNVASSSKSKKKQTMEDYEKEEEEIELMERDETLRKSMSLFLLKYIANHPNNKKGTVFARHYKIALKACQSEILDFE